MLSFLHEGLIVLVRDQPAFVADLLTQLLDVSVPRFARATNARSSSWSPRRTHWWRAGRAGRSTWAEPRYSTPMSSVPMGFRRSRTPTRIRECTDLVTLDLWLDRAFSVASVEDLLT